MTLNNKLKIAILTILSSQTVNALTLEPIDVQSSSGNLLYAEIKFRNADPSARIEAGLAESQDLMALGLSHQPPGHLNFYTRRSGDGTGVIVITSSRPMLEPELNILLKIKEGNATHVQQIKTNLRHNTVPSNEVPLTLNEKSLIPQMIVSEKDIALNLPVSAQITTPVQEQNTTAVTPSTSTGVTPTNNTTSSPAPAISVAPKSRTTSTENTTTTVTVRSGTTPAKAPQQAAQAKPKDTQPATETKQNATSTSAQNKNASTSDAKNAPKSHIVQANESLWKIASRIAAQTNQSIPEVMQQIKANNKHAFIDGNINRIRQGTALNLAAGYQPEKKQAGGAKPAPSTAKTQKQAGKTKYRLSQAEMSLVTASDSNEAQGTGKEKTEKNQTTPELSSKVMTAREKTVKLQKNVSQSTLALKQKDMRIQLLNTRLAQLEEQLKQQNQAKKAS